MGFKEQAHDESKKGGNIERAKVLALLALVEAIEDNTEEIRSLGAENFPVHVEHLSKVRVKTVE
jgi:hypothetical protein